MKMQGLLLSLKLICMFAISIMFGFVPVKSCNDESYQLGFADIEITLTKGAQIQVEALLAAYPSQVFLDNIIELEAYLALIEQQLITQKIPTDYKYACLHKFYLQNNTQKAGFWGLEIEKALALGLKVNAQIDERFNPVAATREVMIEIRRNNIYFKNWLINLITLEAPFQDVKAYIRDKYFRHDLVGVKKWQIDEDSHPFLREVLAFKHFMQHKIEPHFTHQVQLSVEMNLQFQSLKQIAKVKNIELEALQQYNTWLKRNKIPSDKVYPVLIPMPKVLSNQVPIAAQIQPETSPELNPLERIPDEEFVPVVLSTTSNATEESSYSWKKHQDEMKAIIARQEEELAQMQPTQVQNVVYPLPSTPVVAQAQTHIVIKGQTLYSIAKMYGITVQALRTYNGLAAQATEIYPDQVLLLQPNNQAQSIKAGGNLIHFVRVGETFESIAKAYNVSGQEIRAWNQLSQESFLEIGQKLIIYVTKQTKRIFKTHNSSATPLRVQAPYQSQSLTQKLAQYTTKAPSSEGVMRGQTLLRSTSVLKQPKLLWLPTLQSKE